MSLQLGSLNEAAITALSLSLLNEGMKNLEQLSGRVNYLSGGRVNWAENAFLPILFKLEYNGLIESTWPRDEYGSRTRVYQITKRGKQEIMKEQEKWETMYSILGDLLDMRIQRNYMIAG